jgi:hypothetical protein
LTYLLNAMNRFIFQLAVMAALLAGVQSEELRCSEGDKECLAMQMDDASMAVDLLASKLNINQQRKLAATQATTGVALHMDDPYTVRGTGICNRGWLRGDPVSTGEGCRTSCDDEADCNTYCYGTPPHQHWQCLRYDSRCDGLQMMLEGADMSMYTCFDKPQQQARTYQCEQNQNYRSTAVPEDLPGSVTSGVATSQECANLCDATDGCNVYVHNVYGECYLKSRRDSQTADPEDHQTVSCIVED